MAEQFSAEWAKGIIDDGVQKAQSLIDNPEQLDELLAQLQEKLMGLPDALTSAFNNVPLMAAMVKSYVTREYTAVSPKVVISLVSAFVYLVKKNDLIPDDTRVIGYLDDVAVATAAMMINEPELKDFADWREQNENPPIEVEGVVEDAGVAEVEGIAESAGATGEATA